MSGANQSRGAAADEDNLTTVSIIILSPTVNVRSWTSSLWWSVCVWMCVYYIFYVVVFRCETLRHRRLSVFGLRVISILTAGFDSQ